MKYGLSIVTRVKISRSIFLTAILVIFNILLLFKTDSKYWIGLKGKRKVTSKLDHSHAV